MPKSRFSDSQIIAILQQAKAGIPMPKLCGEHNISNQTFYSWRRKFCSKVPAVATPMPLGKNDNQQSKTTCAKTKPKDESPPATATIA